VYFSCIIHIPIQKTIKSPHFSQYAPIFQAKSSFIRFLLPRSITKCAVHFSRSASTSSSNAFSHRACRQFLAQLLQESFWRAFKDDALLKHSSTTPQAHTPPASSPHHPQPLRQSHCPVLGRNLRLLAKWRFAGTSTPLHQSCSSVAQWLPFIMRENEIYAN